MNDTTLLLEARGLSLAIAGRVLCEGLDLDVRAQQAWAIVGPNGAGKTTLLRTLAGLAEPAAGDVRYAGTPISMLSPRERALRRGMLPQDSQDAFAATVLETVLVGRHPHLSRFAWEDAHDLAVADRQVDVVDRGRARTRVRDGHALELQHQPMTIRRCRRRRRGTARCRAPRRP